MQKRMWGYLIAAMLLGSLVACGTDEPDDNENDSGSDDSGTPEPEDDYYPMAVGNKWVYKEVFFNQPGAEEELVYEVVAKEPLTLDYQDGRMVDVFKIENTFPAEPLEKRYQYIEDDGKRALRHLQQIYDTTGVYTKRRDFVPGFLRFDRDKLQPGTTWSETVDRYINIDPEGSGTPEKETLVYNYTVLDDDEEITVDAGTFKCLSIKRDVHGDNRETKVYYFHRGIGKVKEITVGDKEETLVSFTPGAV